MSITGVVRTYYNDGELKEEWFEINGKKEGDYKRYSNGQILIFLYLYKVNLYKIIIIIKND